MGWSWCFHKCDLLLSSNNNNAELFRLAFEGRQLWSHIWLRALQSLQLCAAASWILYFFYYVFCIFLYFLYYVFCIFCIMYFVFFCWYFRIFGLCLFWCSAGANCHLQCRHFHPLLNCSLSQAAGWQVQAQAPGWQAQLAGWLAQAQAAGRQVQTQ